MIRCRKNCESYTHRVSFCLAGPIISVCRKYILITIEFSRFCDMYLLIKKQLHRALPGILIPDGYSYEMTHRAFSCGTGITR